MLKTLQRLTTAFKKCWVKMVFWLAPDTHTIVERVRLSIFVFTLLVLVGILPLHVAGLIGYQDPYIRVINTAWLVLQPLLIWGVRTGRLTLTRALVTQLLVAQVRLTVAMFFCACRDEGYDASIVWIYLTFELLAVLLSLLAQLRNIPSLLSALAVCSYIAVMAVNDDPLLVSYCPMMVFIFILSAVLGKRLLDGISELQTENDTLRDEDERILSTIGLERDAALALTEVASTPDDTLQPTGRFIGLLQEPTRKTLFDAVERHVRIRETELALLQRVFPELSESEREICRLVLQGKKQVDVCRELGKSKGNITSQRTHIRTKLHLKPKDNLADVLHQRLAAYNMQAFRPQS